MYVPYYVHNETMDDLNDWESFGKAGKPRLYKNTHNAEKIYVVTWLFLIHALVC